MRQLQALRQRKQRRASVLPAHGGSGHLDLVLHGERAGRPLPRRRRRGCRERGHRGGERRGFARATRRSTSARAGVVAVVAAVAGTNSTASPSCSVSAWPSITNSPRALPNASRIAPATTVACSSRSRPCTGELGAEAGGHQAGAPASVCTSVGAALAAASAHVVACAPCRTRMPPRSGSGTGERLAAVGDDQGCLVLQRSPGQRPADGEQFDAELRRRAGGRVAGANQGGEPRRAAVADGEGACGLGEGHGRLGAQAASSSRGA